MHIKYKGDGSLDDEVIKNTLHVVGFEIFRYKSHRMNRYH